MGRLSNNIKNRNKQIALDELTIKLYSVIHTFKSKERPKSILTDEDVLKVLAGMLASKIDSL